MSDINNGGKQQARETRSITPRRATEHYHKFECPRAFCPLPLSLCGPLTILLMLVPPPLPPAHERDISPWPPPFLRLTLWQRLNLATTVGARSLVTNIPGCAAWGAAVMHRPRCPTYASSLRDMGASTGHLRFQRARTRFYEWLLTSGARPSLNAAPQDRLISLTPLTGSRKSVYALTLCSVLPLLFNISHGKL